MLRLYKSVSFSNFPVLKYSIVWEFYGKLYIARTAFFWSTSTAPDDVRDAPNQDSIPYVIYGRIKELYSIFKIFCGRRDEVLYNIPTDLDNLPWI